MSGELVLRVFDVEHGACTMLTHSEGGQEGRLAMIDSGHNSSTDWHPSTFIKNRLRRDRLDYLFVTNADQDHLSDLEGLWEQEITVAALYRNRSPAVEILRQIKQQQGELTDDIERFLTINEVYTSPITEPFNQYMGGITESTFYNKYPQFTDTNNLSLVVFIKFGWFKMLFPGDMEEDGWLSLLKQEAFVKELAGTNILVASHHGRLSGYCDEIFEYFTPDAVVISDKPIAHSTQETVPDYRAVVRDLGVIVETTGKRRHVLTTRRDGDITFFVGYRGLRIVTECRG